MSPIKKIVLMIRIELNFQVMEIKCKWMLVIKKFHTVNGSQFDNIHSILLYIIQKIMYKYKNLE